ncbi:hypothetical protein BC833DRAFT_616549 [Globomyces pollinis-pini]|nr:hypothetical protein BC833DRAFT_616549 [Globomyces pollinis-pini]
MNQQTMEDLINQFETFSKSIQSMENTLDRLKSEFSNMSENVMKFESLQSPEQRERVSRLIGLSGSTDIVTSPVEPTSPRIETKLSLQEIPNRVTRPRRKSETRLVGDALSLSKKIVEPKLDTNDNTKPNENSKTILKTSHEDGKGNDHVTISINDKNEIPSIVITDEQAPVDKPTENTVDRQLQLGTPLKRIDEVDIRASQVSAHRPNSPPAPGPAPAPAPIPTTTPAPAPEPVKVAPKLERKSSTDNAKEKEDRSESIFFGKIFKKSFFKQPVVAPSTKATASVLKLNQRDNAVFHPYSLAVQLWNSFYMIFMIWMVIFVPMAIGYQHTLSRSLVINSIINTVVIFLDTLIKYNTGIFVEQKLEFDIDLIRKKHLKDGSIFFDFITAFPWVFVAYAMSPELTNLRTGLTLICMINTLPILNVFGSKNRVSYIAEKTTNFLRVHGVNAALVDSFTILIAMVFYWHWNASFTMNFRDLGILTIPENYKSEFEEYTHAVFAAAGEMLANGWGSDVPHTTVDRWFKVVNMIISATFLAIFIGNVSAFMIGLDSSGKRYNEVLEEVNQYISYKGFGENLRSRIVKYYQFKYSGGKFFNEERILSELNQPLRQYIALRECQDLILKVPFFKDADKQFITQVVMILRVNHYLPGDYVIEEGTSGDHMFFIASGTVEAIINGVARAKLSPGLFFGEIALLFGRMKRTASIRAVTHCVLYSLSREDLNAVLEINPYMSDKMKQVAADRLAADAKAKAQAAAPQPEQQNNAIKGVVKSSEMK